MASGEPSSNRNNYVAPEEQADAAVPDPSVLEQVLEETVSATSDEPLTGQELDALKAVAERHGPCAFDLDPVGFDLIAAMIRLRFPSIKSPELRAEMARQIAGTMFEAPEVHARLEGLWRKLSGASP